MCCTSNESRVLRSVSSRCQVVCTASQSIGYRIRSTDSTNQAGRGQGSTSSSARRVASSRSARFTGSDLFTGFRHSVADMLTVIASTPTHQPACNRCPFSKLALVRSRAGPPPRGIQPDSSFAAASIQSTASSERKKPSGPDSPTHHALEVTAPPAAAILLSTSDVTASPLWAMSHALASESTFAHHSMVSMRPPLHRMNPTESRSLPRVGRRRSSRSSVLRPAGFGTPRPITFVVMSLAAVTFNAAKFCRSTLS